MSHSNSQVPMFTLPNQGELTALESTGAEVSAGVSQLVAANGGVIPIAQTPTPAPTTRVGLPATLPTNVNHSGNINVISTATSVC
jgi:hypothetical protein